MNRQTEYELKMAVQNFPEIARREFGYARGMRGCTSEYVSTFATLVEHLHPSGDLLEALHRVNYAIQNWKKADVFEDAMSMFENSMGEVQ